MKEKVLLFIKGFIIGIANIIPGVSGGTLAITLGIYDRLISIVSKFYKNIWSNIKYLLPIGLGALFSIITLSKGINYCLTNYEIITVLFFMGLILGGIPSLFKKVKKEKIKIKNIIIMLITFSIVVLFSFISEGNNVVDIKEVNVLILFVIGVVAAATMVIPGISGSFVLMLLGFYKPIVETISQLTNFDLLWSNMRVLIPFGIGIVVGIVVIAKIIDYLLHKFKISTYYGIIGFVLSSCISILVPLSGFTLINLLVGLVFLSSGFMIVYKIGE